MNAVAGMSADEFSRAQINLETAQIAWRELQPYFARGVTVAVSADLDLVEVAYQISQDNTQQVTEWLTTGQLCRVADEQALTWYEADTLVWAVVARPYVLIQEKRNVLHR